MRYAHGRTMSMRGRFLREVALAGLPDGAGPVDTIAASQIACLPDPAQRYLRQYSTRLAPARIFQIRLMRARWGTPVAGWEAVGGRLLPSAVQAVWHLPEGPFAYADFRSVPGSPAFNVPPGA